MRFMGKDQTSLASYPNHLDASPDPASCFRLQTATLCRPIYVEPTLNGSPDRGYSAICSPDPPTSAGKSLNIVSQPPIGSPGSTSRTSRRSCPAVRICSSVLRKRIAVQHPSNGLFVGSEGGKQHWPMGCYSEKRQLT